MNDILSKRNSAVFQNGKKQLVAYFPAGYPDGEAFFDVVSDSEASGVTIFEIGFPALNPSLDGPVIRDALKAVDPSLVRDLAYWRKLRDTVSAPIWVIGYKEDFVESGAYKILAREGVADALVLPDISLEERRDIAAEVSAQGVDVLGFANPDMSIGEMKECLSSFPIVYYQMYLGVTGMKGTICSYARILECAHEYAGTKLLAGFGIDTPELALSLLDSGFDGVIIGTAMIERLSDSETDLLSFIRSLSRVPMERNG